MINKIFYTLISAVLVALATFAFFLGPVVAAFNNIKCENKDFYQPAKNGIDLVELKNGDGIIWGYDEKNNIIAGGWFTKNEVSDETVVLPAINGINTFTVEIPGEMQITVRPLICDDIMFQLIADPEIVRILGKKTPVAPTPTPWKIFFPPIKNNG